MQLKNDTSPVTPQEGEELTITYGKVWFEDRSLPAKRAEENDPVHHHMDDPDSFLAALEVENIQL